MLKKYFPTIMFYNIKTYTLKSLKSVLGSCCTVIQIIQTKYYLIKCGRLLGGANLSGASMTHCTQFLEIYLLWSTM
jgi:hypothetical protein